MNALNMKRSFGDRMRSAFGASPHSDDGLETLAIVGVFALAVVIVLAVALLGSGRARAADVGLTDAERASIETQLRARGYPCDRLESLERKADDPATGALIFKATCGRRQVYRGVVADVFNVAGSIAVAPWNYRKHGR